MKSCRTVLIVAGLLTCCFSFEADAAGALVRGSNNKLYWGVQASSVDIAVQQALDSCAAEAGGGCSVLVTYVSGCLVIASAQPGFIHWSYAVRENPRHALFAAMRDCTRFSAQCNSQLVGCE